MRIWTTMTGTITGFAIFSTILFLYLISNTVGRSQYFSNGITAEERSLFSSTLLCIDNPTATLIITDLEVRDRTADGSAVVFGYTVFGEWRRKVSTAARQLGSLLEAPMGKVR